MKHKPTPLARLLLLTALGWLSRPASAPAAVQPTAGMPPNLVATVPVDGLVRKPADPIDLEGRTLRFTPAADGSYAVETLPSADLADTGARLPDSRAVTSWPVKAWRVSLPFSFPYAGKSWNHVFVNLNGNLSFDTHEGTYWPQRDPWASGGMRSVAAALDSRSAAGLEQMIAVLWAVYDVDASYSSVRTQASADRLVVTWDVRRSDWSGAPRGESLFQARLYPSGVIEFAYSLLAEPDGIVGLFTGQPVAETLLDHVQPTGRAPDPSVDVASVDVYDAGTVLKFVYTMRNDVATHVATGTLMYRFFMNVWGSDDDFGVNVTNQPGTWSNLGPDPATVGFQIAGRTVTVYVSKTVLASRKTFTYYGDVVWWGFSNRYVQIAWGKHRTINLLPAQTAETDLTAASGPQKGNLFEVFHYPLVSRRPDPLLQAVYQQFPPNDDIAMVCTDFPMDEIYPGEGEGSGPRNVPIQGIGPWPASPQSTDALGTRRLQVSMATFWIGGPAFVESGVYGSYHFRNFAKAVFWMAHETTHRWGPALSFRNPMTGETEPLTNVHWLPGLHAPPFVPVLDNYLDPATPAASIMGGDNWTQNSDGTFRPSLEPWAMPGGLSALDLYTMGLLSPEEVPDTFILENLQEVSSTRYRANKVPVRIQDIIAAMGPRVPDSGSAQKEFRMAIYLVHEPGHEPDPALVDRANRLALAVAGFFETATGGRMKIIHSRLQP